MGQEFEGDLTESVFWGADLSRSTIRDVNLTGVRMHGVWLTDVAVDGFVERLVINGVDVTEYVNAHDRWQPLRGMLRPDDAAGLAATWDELDRAWSSTIERAQRLTGEQQRQSVNGEFSFVQTLRHLVFAIDKWFTVPIDGGAFAAFGLSNTGSLDFPWPGIDRAADPSIDEVLAVLADRNARLRAYFGRVTDAELRENAEILENGTVPVIDCCRVVFEEAFEHLRYARRDLDAIESETGTTT